MDSKDTPTTSTSKTTTTSEFESEEISVETSVPTDLTLSPESDFGRRRPVHGNLITKQLLERKQLLHDLQLIKIELSQKTLVIDNLKADFMARTEELEEKLADAVHQKQILQARLEMQLQIQQEEAKTRLEQTKLEIGIILRKQKELEEVNAKLQDKSDEVRNSLNNLELDEQQYDRLRIQDASQLSLKDFVAAKVYDMVWNYKMDFERTKTQLSLCNEDNHHLRKANHDLKEELEAQKLKSSDLQTKYTNALAELNTVKSRIQTSNFRIENYDKLKSERDKFLEELLDVKNSFSNTRATESVVKKELEDSKSEKAALQQRLNLIQQDKEFLDKRVAEVTSQNKALEDNLAKASLQLDKVTQAREDMYDKYIAARDLYKTEFERKLQEEIDTLRTKMASEIETLKRVSRDMHEQEIRSLKDTRDLAISQRDKAEAAERQAMGRYENLLDELRQNQSGNTTQLSNFKTQLALKTFELEQLRQVHVETHKNLLERQIENEKLLKKVEILNQEFQDTERQLKQRIHDLEVQEKDKSAKLSVYERLEHELDDAIMQAAEVSTTNEGNNKLLSLVPTMGVPTTSQRRLEHSFHLAKRIFLLEKQNQVLKRRLENEEQAAHQHLEELENLKDLLEHSNKPNAYLIDLIKQKDEQIRDQKITISQLNEELSTLKNDQKILEMKLRVLTKDTEVLLKNREEIEKMKQLLLTAFPDHFDDMKLSSAAKSSTMNPTPLDVKNKS